MLHLGRFQQRIDFVEKMFQEKGRPVLFHAFRSGVAFSLAVAAVGSQVDWNRGVMLTAPSHIECNEIMRAGVKEHVDVASAELFKVSRDKHAVGNVPSQLL